VTQNNQISKEQRANISLTGVNAKRLRELHSLIQNSPMAINVSLADVVNLALVQLEAKLKNN
jgi:hypothetical protein